MNKPKISTCVGLITGSVVALSASAAQAFTFTTTIAPGSAPPKGNVILQSVEFDGRTVTDFALVNAANILFNDPATDAPNSGGASTDQGKDIPPDANAPVANPNGNQVAATLGNLNLNKIIDTEDLGNPDGRFEINLLFDKLVENLFFWERNSNSRLKVQAIDTAGNLLGNSVILGTGAPGEFGYTDAGYSIETTEIPSAQPVGSVGVRLSDLNVLSPIKGIKVIAEGDFRGPDFKVVGEAASVPEPATLAGLGLVAGAMAVSRRRKATKTS